MEFQSNLETFALQAALAKIEPKFDVIRSVGEECNTEADLRKLLLAKSGEFRLYDGFEPSGRMHIAQGIFKAVNVNKCTSAGGTFVFWVADWFALMNDKMGGDLEKIKIVGEYLIEVWKAAGMDMSKVEFRWASQDITDNAEQYWNKMLQIARCFNISRIKKCCQIMGRKENSLTAAQILYPLMQCTDIFFLRADICQLGVDQRKVNMLARDYCDQVGIKNKPVILSHHMLYGLKKGQEKMSKSDPDSAIFMEDTREDVERKIKKAYCPSKPEAAEEAGEQGDSMHLVEDDLKNPCLDYVEHIVMSKPKAVFKVGDKKFTSFAAVKEAFVGGKISEEQLKDALIKAINLMLDPVRAHFVKNENAKRLLEQVRQFKREDAPATKTVRRLNLFPESDNVAVVFAPIVESSLISMGSVMSLVNQLRSVPEGSKKVLYMSDLSALVLNAFSAEAKFETVQKNIRASTELLIATAKLVSPSAFKDVEEVWQSEAMLKNPSDYWISVINAGRTFQLDRVLGGTDQRAGLVVSSLMRVADVLGTNARVVVAPAEDKALASLATDFVRDTGIAGVSGIQEPQVVLVETPTLFLKEVKGNVFDADKELFVTDTIAAGALKKINKAFCEPGNTTFNPVLDMAIEFCIKETGSIAVARSAEHGGGSVEYKSAEDLKKAFASGEVHPGDLKPAVKSHFNGIFEQLAKVSKSDKKVAGMFTAMKNYLKKANKAKK